MSGQNVRVSSGYVMNLITDVTEVSDGPGRYKASVYTSIQATVVGDGAVSATVVIDASNDGEYWCATPMATVTLSGTDSNSDGFTTVAPWKFIRARVTAISGTDAAVTVLMGV